MQGLCKKCTVHWLTAIQWSPMGHQSSLLDCHSRSHPQTCSRTHLSESEFVGEWGRKKTWYQRRERGGESRGLGG